MKPLLLILFVLIIGLNYGADVKGFGYFLEGGSMKKAKLEQLSKQGTTDLFFNYYGIEIWDVSRVEPWISQANNYNIRVHIWCDSYNNGNWIYNSRDTIRLNRYIKAIQSYARISGVYGILLGEINYAGSSPEAAQGIVQTIKLIIAGVRQVNKNCLLSVKLNPGNFNDIYYQQFYEVVSQYFDFVVPYMFKGYVNENVSTIKKIVEGYVKYSKGASVWGQLESRYNVASRNNVCEGDLRKFIQSALDAGGKGAIIYEWEIAEKVNFNALNQ